MYYSLNNNVYLVEGKSKDCIYDLAEKKLYHIHKELSLLIKKVGIQSINSLKLSDDENKAIENLKKSNLLTETENIVVNNIKNISQKLNINFSWIEVCTFCNLKCKHCYNESSAQCHESMSYDDFVHVCHELLSIGVKKVQLIGGEPFCCKDIRKMLEYATNKFEFVEVFTNGILINENWCEFFKEKEIHVALSVYSYIPEEHDKVTLQKGSHSKTIHSIELLNQYKIGHRIATVFMKDIDIGEKNTDVYTLNTKKDVIRMAGRGNIDLLTPELLKKKLITKNTFSYQLNPDYVKSSVSGNNCFGTKLYISADFEVYPCVMERRISHGNMKNAQLKDIIKPDICAFNKDKVECCKECEFRYACSDCRPDSLSDNIYNKPYYCTYDVENGQWLNTDDVIKTILGK